MRGLFLFLFLAFLPACTKENYTMRCCQHYNGETSGWILTTEAEYENAVLKTWGVDMEGQLDYDSARVMFIHCKEL